MRIGVQSGCHRTRILVWQNGGELVARIIVWQNVRELVS